MYNISIHIHAISAPIQYVQAGDARCEALGRSQFGLLGTVEALLHCLSFISYIPCWSGFLLFQDFVNATLSKNFSVCRLVSFGMKYTLAPPETQYVRSAIPCHDFSMAVSVSKHALKLLVFGPKPSISWNLPTSVFCTNSKLIQKPSAFNTPSM